MSDSIFDYVSIYENVLDDKTLSTFIKICETTESFEDDPVFGFCTKSCKIC